MVNWWRLRIWFEGCDIKGQETLFRHPFCPNIRVVYDDGWTTVLLEEKPYVKFKAKANDWSLTPLGENDG